MAILTIIGIGVDMIEVSRIQSALDRFGDRFLNRVFAPGEQRYALSRPNPAESLAARFAAKEAVMKALGTGRYGVSWREIEVVRTSAGRPGLVLSGRTLAVARFLGVREWHLSLTHGREQAIAFAVALGQPGSPE
ncbi:MAG TPA: holo-ACP synthase [Limnochorda sp.]